MTSQVDLDQGGTFRTWIRQYLGPTIGWVNLPGQSIFPINATGTYILTPDITFVPVNVISGPVIIILPPAQAPFVPAVAQPQLFGNVPITILDVGGAAGSNPITIQPSDMDSIMAQPSITINVAYGGYTFSPNNGIWNA